MPNNIMDTLRAATDDRPVTRAFISPFFTLYRDALVETGHGRISTAFYCSLSIMFSPIFLVKGTINAVNALAGNDGNFRPFDRGGRSMADRSRVLSWLDSAEGIADRIDVELELEREQHRREQRERELRLNELRMFTFPERDPTLIARLNAFYQHVNIEDLPGSMQRLHDAISLTVITDVVCCKTNRRQVGASGEANSPPIFDYHYYQRESFNQTVRGNGYIEISSRQHVILDEDCLAEANRAQQLLIDFMQTHSPVAQPILNSSASALNGANNPQADVQNANISFRTFHIRN